MSNREGRQWFAQGQVGQHPIHPRPHGNRGGSIAQSAPHTPITRQQCLWAHVHRVAYLSRGPLPNLPTPPFRVSRYGHECHLTAKFDHSIGLCTGSARSPPPQAPIPNVPLESALSRSFGGDGDTRHH